MNSATLSVKERKVTDLYVSNAVMKFYSKEFL